MATKMDAKRSKNEETEKMLTEKELDAKIDELYRKMSLTEDTTCGWWIFKGSFFQMFANKKSLIFLFCVAGCFYGSTFAYFNGTITTLEKRFKLSSKTLGIVSIGNDITQLLASVVLNYYASKGHKPRWLAVSLLCVAIFCFMNTLPQIIYGSGEDALYLTKEFNAKTLNNTDQDANNDDDAKYLCGSEENEICRVEEGSITPVVIWFIAQLIAGMGGTLYHSIGYSYMDDNIKKSKSPVFISLTHFLRMLGPAVGYGLVSVCLKFYISPSLTPTIDNTDPRWLGAWWFGWVILGSCLLVLAGLMSTLPKTLPRAAARKEIYRQISNEPIFSKEVKPSLQDLMMTLKKLLLNPIYNFNNFASVFYVFGYTPFWIFLPKYIELEYRKSASAANLVTGTVGLAFTALGILLTGIFLQKVKPKAKYLAFWNMTVDFISMLGILSYLFLNCPDVDSNLPIFSDQGSNSMNCSADCKCDFVRFSPICSLDRSQTYISPCHAGCTQEEKLDNGTILLSNCSCIANPLNYIVENFTNGFEISHVGGSATNGPCPVNCDKQFYFFLAIICLCKFMGATSRVSNFLIAVRCVDDKDKPISLGLTMTAVSVFGFIPGPIFFGYVIDSTCLIWGKTCSGIGNCLLYNPIQFRERLVYIASVFLGIAIIFDFLIFSKISDINIFDDDVPKSDIQLNNLKKINDTNEKSSTPYTEAC